MSRSFCADICELLCSETGILSFSGKDDRGNDIKAEIENKGDHLEVTVTQSNYEDIIGTKQEFFQADE